MPKPSDDTLARSTPLSRSGSEAEAEAALRESEERFRTLVEMARDAILTLDEQSVLHFANPAAERIFGYPPEELVGRSLTELIPARFRTAHRAGIERYLRTGERRIPWDGVELVGLHRDGSEIPLEVSFTEFTRSDRRFFIGTLRDISERKLADAALQEREEQFGTLANGIPQLAWMADAEGWIFWYNQRWYEYTGTAPVDMEGWGWQSVHDPDALPEVMERWTESIRTGEPFDMTFPLRGADGVFRPFLTRVLPVRDVAGTVVRWFGTNTDITEQRDAQERQRFLAEAGTLLGSSLDFGATLARLVRLAVPTLADWCAVDLLEDGQIRRVALAHSDPEKEAIAEEIERRYPADAEAPTGAPHVLRTGEAELVSEIPRELLENAALDPEHRRLLRLLDLRSYLIVPLAARGRVLGALTLVAAESDRRFGEDDLRFAQELADRAAIAVDNARLYREAEAAKARTTRILESIADAFFALDREWRFTYVNAAAERLFGRRAKQLIARSLWEEYPETLDSPFWKEYHRAVRENTPVRFEEFVPTTGTWYEFDAYPSQEGLSVFFRDVTRRKRAEAERDDLFAALERSNAALDDFAYVASHDLKAPLRGIGNLAQWIEQDLGDAVTGAAREQFELLRVRVQRTEALIDGILAYSRAGRTADGSERVDVGRLLEEVTDLLDPPEEFEVRIEEAMPTLETPRLPLQQVFLNLIGNAIKYGCGDDGGGRAEVSCAGADDGFVEFVVADRGPGIAPEFHDRIFGIFQTLRSAEEGGTGIGLSLVKKMVEARGGRVRVESAEGEGTTFRFTWPVAAAGTEARK
ncbi:hypothetical protein BH20GEM2_BH20GEM2_12220 [soil metagenome]